MKKPIKPNMDQYTTSDCAGDATFDRDDLQALLDDPNFCSIEATNRKYYDDDPSSLDVIITYFNKTAYEKAVRNYERDLEAYQAYKKSPEYCTLSKEKKARAQAIKDLEAQLKVLKSHAT
mgnify:CR=1 FL=1